MFEHITPSHIQSSLSLIRAHSRGLSPANRARIHELTSSFSSFRDWNVVASRWSDIFLEAAQSDPGTGELLHAYVIAFVTLLFSIGFDTGLQSFADREVQRILSSPPLLSPPQPQPKSHPKSRTPRPNPKPKAPR